MDKELAKLVIEHKEDLFPYLLIRSHYVYEGKVTKDAANEEIGQEKLSILQDSGFIKVLDGEVLFEDEDGWFYLPRTRRRPQRKQSNFDKQIDALARIVGIPPDLESQRGKYRSLYRKLLNEGYSYGKIETIAYDNEGMKFNMFMTPSVFKNLVKKHENASR